MPPSSNAHLRALRGEVQGWTASSTRSNTRFLYSVDRPKLTGRGFALSLTLRYCPPFPEDWHAVRRAFLKRLSRRGLIRCHWLTEWQSRGVPHLHAAVWFPADNLAIGCHEIREHWLAVARPFGAKASGQHVADMDNDLGWFQYLSKHAVRGLSHYQRNPENIPPEWGGNTGRMWGRTGDWPTQELRLAVDKPVFYRFRRVMRGLRVAAARRDRNLRRAARSRRMLRCPNRALSSVRGTSEWLGLAASLDLISWLHRTGGLIES